MKNVNLLTYLIISFVIVLTIDQLVMTHNVENVNITNVEYEDIANISEYETFSNWLLEDPTSGRSYTTENGNIAYKNSYVNAHYVSDLINDAKNESYTVYAVYLANDGNTRSDAVGMVKLDDKIYFVNVQTDELVPISDAYKHFGFKTAYFGTGYRFSYRKGEDSAFVEGSIPSDFCNCSYMNLRKESNRDDDNNDNVSEYDTFLYWLREDPGSRHPHIKVTGNKTYQDSYVCSHYVRDLINNATKAGYMVYAALLANDSDHIGHAVGITKLDNEIYFVEAQIDNLIPIYEAYDHFGYDGAYLGLNYNITGNYNFIEGALPENFCNCVIIDRMYESKSVLYVDLKNGNYSDNDRSNNDMWFPRLHIKEFAFPAH